MIKKSQYHFHRIAPGSLRACWHVCQMKWKSFVFGFLAANTMTFPLEHFLWEHVYPFTLITRWLGL